MNLIMLKLCTLASGSNGNCTYITNGVTHILIDAGISARMITSELNCLGISLWQIDSILITHEHSDHIRGLETLLKKNKTLQVFSTSGTAAEIITKIPLAEDRILRFETDELINIGDIEISSFNTPHDTAESVGYRISAGGKTAVLATDLGHVSENLMEFLIGADLLLLEANYDEARLRNGRYPEFLKRRISGDNGHLSNSDCASCVYRAVKSGTRHVLLGHLSAENNSPEIAYTTVHTALTRQGIIPGVDMMLNVAPRGRRGEVLVLD